MMFQHVFPSFQFWCLTWVVFPWFFVHHFQAVFRSLEDSARQAQVGELQQKLGVAHLEAWKTSSRNCSGFFPRVWPSQPGFRNKSIINPDSIIQSIFIHQQKPTFSMVCELVVFSNLLTKEDDMSQGKPRYVEEHLKDRMRLRANSCHSSDCKFQSAWLR